MNFTFFFLIIVNFTFRWGKNGCRVSDCSECNHINRGVTDTKGGKILICVIEPYSSQILERHYFISPEQ